MKRYWIWLNELKGISLSDKHKLLEMYGTPECIYQSNHLNLNKTHMKRSEQLLEDHAKLEIGMWTIDDFNKEKHCALKNKKAMPLVLYYKGKPNWEEKSCAVVGSRKCSFKGYRATQSVVDHLLEQGYVINSGLGKGIDGIAHSRTLELNGITQAFVAHGLDECYPKIHRELLEQIVMKGAVISPFAVGTKPLKHHFLIRNEIMVMFSNRVAIIEAAHGSGTMTTAEFAIKHLKPLWVVPETYRDTENDAVKTLIKQGALVFKEALFESEEKYEEETVSKIMNQLASSPLSTDQIAEGLVISVDVVDELLCQLELDGLVGYDINGKWCRLK